MKPMYILLVFTFILFQSYAALLSFKKSKSNHQQKTVETYPEPEPSLQECENCMCLTCNYTLPNPKKIINPYREELKNFVPRTPFGSFCTKCAACLAVAQQMEKTIKSLSYECETDPLKKSVLLQNIIDHVNNLCTSGFKNFDLREYKDHRILTDDFRCTTHIESSMDGNWTKKYNFVYLVGN